MSDPQAAFQRALLALLARGLPPREVRQHLVDDPALAPLRSYCESLDLHALQVARELYTKWSTDP